MRTIIVLVLAICFALVAAQEKEYSFELNAPKITLGYLKELIKHGERMRDVLAQKESVQAAEATEEAMSDSFIGSGQTVQATQGVNIRSGPCTNYRIVGGLSSGSTATATGSSSSGCGYTWYQIRGSFGTGYVASNFVRAVSRPSPAPTPSHGGSSGSLTVSQLRQIMPNLSSSKANEYISHINNALSWASINTCLRKSAFLAQLAHESADLRYMEEIASGAAYEGRRDLGNTQPGDGRRYKGRGPIQLTGRANYRTAGRDLGVDLEGNPTLAATPQWGFKVAAWYWKTRSLNQYADQGTQSGYDQVTRRINGGYNGKADRDSKWRRARSVLGC